MPTHTSSQMDKPSGRPARLLLGLTGALLALLILNLAVFDDLRMELTQARDYYAYKRRCVFCDTVREEIASGEAGSAIEALEDDVGALLEEARKGLGGKPVAPVSASTCAVSALDPIASATAVGARPCATSTDSSAVAPPVDRSCSRRVPDTTPIALDTLATGSPRSTTAPSTSTSSGACVAFTTRIPPSGAGTGPTESVHAARATASETGCSRKPTARIRISLLFIAP